MRLDCYQTIPSRTLATHTRKGTKFQTAKDRLTALLCCNATGDHKIDPLEIGKAARPTAFGPKQGGWEPSSVHIQYTSNKSAWMNAKVFTGSTVSIGRCKQNFENIVQRKLGCCLIIVQHMHIQKDPPQYSGEIVSSFEDLK